MQKAQFLDRLSGIPFQRIIELANGGGDGGDAGGDALLRANNLLRIFRVFRIFRIIRTLIIFLIFLISLIFHNYITIHYFLNYHNYKIKTNGSTSLEVRNMEKLM